MGFWGHFDGLSETGCMASSYCFAGVSDDRLIVVDHHLDLVAHDGQGSEIPADQVLALSTNMDEVNSKGHKQETEGNRGDA